MRLFLSSQDLGNYAERAAQLAGDNKKVALIRNAKDELPADERDETTPEKIRMFEAVGFSCEPIDLRDYFGKPNELEAKLQDFGAIFCSGGNTFLLRRAMKASGLDTILLKRLKEDSVMYGGWSAGACICAPSLRGVENGDRPSPDLVPPDYPSKATIWDGLNLVPFMIVPHCDQEWFRDAAKKTVDYLRQNKLAFIELNDGEVVVVDGDETEVLR